MSFEINLAPTKITSVGYNDNVDPYKFLFKIIFDNIKDFSVTLMTKPNLTKEVFKDISKNVESLVIRSKAEKTNTSINIINNSKFKSVSKIAIITTLSIEELEDKFLKWVEVTYDNLFLTAGIFTALKDCILIKDVKCSIDKLCITDNVDLIIIDNVASIISEKGKFSHQYQIAKDIISLNASTKVKFLVMQTYNKNIMSSFRTTVKPNFSDIDNDDIWRNSSHKYHFFCPNSIGYTFFEQYPVKTIRKNTWYTLYALYDDCTDSLTLRYLK